MENIGALAEFLKNFYHEELFIFPEPVYEHLESSDENMMVNEEEVTLSANNETGGYAKGILVLVDSRDGSLLNKTDLHFLEKVLNAIEFKVDHDLIVNVHGYNRKKFDQLFKDRKPKKIISFGVYAGDCGYEDNNLYEINHVHNITWLFADDLKGIQSDISRKKTLWKALRKMFIPDSL